jgi:hypothetical protein
LEVSRKAWNLGIIAYIFLVSMLGSSHKIIPRKIIHLDLKFQLLGGDWSDRSCLALTPFTPSRVK